MDQNQESKYIRFENKESLITKLEEERAELLEEAELLKNSDEFYKMLTLPDVDMNERLRMLRRTFEGTISDESMAFLCVLFEKNGVQDFAVALQEFREMLNQENPVKKGVIYSVKPLSPEQMRTFTAQTEKLLKEEINLVNRIDKSILGGVCILIDGKIIDLSLRKKLEDMHVSIQEGLHSPEEESE